MGINHCNCKRDYSSGDFIYDTFDSMNLRKMDVKDVYKKFSACIVTPAGDEKNEQICLHKLNEKTFSNFLFKIVSNTENKMVQISFFRAIFHLSGNNIDTIKRIGIFLIFNSDGIFSDKLDTLEHHVIKYYGKKERKIREFVYDMVLMNTQICLVAFEKFIGEEEYHKLENLWKTHKIEKYVDNLFSKYEQNYCNSTRTSYYKNVEENSGGISTFTDNKIYNTYKSNPTTLGNNIDKIGQNFIRDKSEGNETYRDLLNKYLSYLLCDLQGDNIRNSISVL